MLRVLKTFSLMALLVFVGVAPARAEVINGVRAVVHDSVITFGEVESDVLVIAKDLYRQYGREPEVFQQKIEAARKDSFDKSLQHQLILNDFKASGYSLPESYIEEIVQREIKSTYGDRATLTKTLQARGITYEKWRQQSKERFLVSQLRLKNIYQETIISPYKIESYYEANKNDFKLEDQVKLRMIMFNKPENTDEIETTRALAEEVLNKLKGGAAFSEMASIYSQGSQRNQGGDWGWVERSVLRKELVETAFSLKPGELSGVIETAPAFFIMLVEDKRSAGFKPISELREQIEETLLKEERERLQKRYIEKLRKKTFVRQFEF
jgi:parvulin-like peptidyl-prolyl isomerase